MSEETSAVQQAKSLKQKQADRGVGRKATTTIHHDKIQVRKPKPHEWVRVHPDADEYSILLTVVEVGAKEDDDGSNKIATRVLCPVHPDLADDPALEADATKHREYILATTRKGKLFVWDHGFSEKENTWIDAEEQNIVRARAGWIRQISYTREGVYNRKEPIRNFPDPDWIKLIAGRSFDEILIEALGDKFITSLDNPYVKELLGY